MTLILSVDAIAQPLTGIGRYTLELANNYRTFGSGDAARFLHGDHWITDPAAPLADGYKPVRGKMARLLSTRETRKLGRWWRQRMMKRCFFHGPNYFLPDVAERGVVTIHDLSVFKYPETHPKERCLHFEKALGPTLKRVSHLITDSEATRREVAEYLRWPIERITAIPLGVSSNYRPRTAAELAAPLRELGLEAGGYSLCVSTLEPRKRVDRLIKAYGRLPDTMKKRWPLVLVGSRGWLSEDLLAQISRAEEEGWLRYLGFVPEASLPLIYAGARAFFLPSLYEGFGLPVLEAMASGIPTLTSDSTSLPEVGGGATFLVPTDHDDELLEGIKKVLSDESWRAEAATKGIAVAGGYTWASCARKTLDLCHSLKA